MGTILRIRTAIEGFYKKACDIDTSLNKTDDNLLDMCSAISKNFGALVGKHDNQLVHDDSAAVSDNLLLNLQDLENLRIELPKDDDDDLVETQFFSRDDIKKKSNELVNKANPKKK